MELQIKPHQISLSPELQSYIDRRLGRLDRFLDRVTDARLELREEQRRSGGLHHIAQLTMRRLTPSRQKWSGRSFAIEANGKAAVMATMRAIARCPQWNRMSKRRMRRRRCISCGRRRFPRSRLMPTRQSSRWNCLVTHSSPLLMPGRVASMSSTGGAMAAMVCCSLRCRRNRDRERE